ncbi:hypothetical protein C8J56DRAFT_962684 [Mycena floridula]|nr:hypothetical protein C8J56DRAFT_962684 [Mycena floridula]
MSTKIRLYDIPFVIPGETWSPNVWKIRYALNHIWVEYPDIENVSKEVGANPTTTRGNGTPLYTLPMIVDPSTNTVVAGSIAIVQYLDETYPDSPRLMAPGTRVLHLSFTDSALSKVPRDFWLHLTVQIVPKLNSTSREFYLKTRGPSFQKFLAEHDSSTPAVYKERLAIAIEGFEKALNGVQSQWYLDERPFFEDKVSFADLIVAADIRWCKAVLGEDSEEWKKIAGWDNGRWGNLIRELEKYE